jgi:hypothetical protein
VDVRVPRGRRHLATAIVDNDFADCMSGAGRSRLSPSVLMAASIPESLFAFHCTVRRYVLRVLVVASRVIFHHRAAVEVPSVSDGPCDRRVRSARASRSAGRRPDIRTSSHGSTVLGRAERSIPNARQGSASWREGSTAKAR